MTFAGCIAAVLLVFSGVLSSEGQSVLVPGPDLYRTLRIRGLNIDTGEVQQAALTAALRAVDPRARMLTRAELQLVNEHDGIVRSELWAEHVGYLKLDGVYRSTGTATVDRVRAWIGSRVEGIIFDLRGARGTDLDSVDTIAGLVVSPGTKLYSITNSVGHTLSTHKTGSDLPLAAKTPVLLVVDGNTTDSSELLAASLRGRDGVMVIGKRTMGDSAVREMISVSTQSAALVATRWAVLPDGATYNGKGVVPDLYLTGAPVPDFWKSDSKQAFGREPTERVKKVVELMKRVGNDEALARAVDTLIGLKALGWHGSTENNARSSGE